MSRNLSSSLRDPVCKWWNDALRDLGMSEDEISAYFARFSNISAVTGAPTASGQAASYSKEAGPDIPQKPREHHAMLKNDVYSEGNSGPDLTPNVFIAAGKRNIEESGEARPAQFEELQKESLYWLARAQTEAKLALELNVRLNAARSLSEAVTAYQEWGSRHIELAAEDAKRIIADSQMLVEAGGRLLSGNWMGSARVSSGRARA